MRKITEIKAIFSNRELLSLNQVATIKGGVAAIAMEATQGTPAEAVLQAVSDDKRRARPGGGASTQLF